MIPTTPSCAFDIGTKVYEPIKMYANDIYTVPANLAGFPAASFPCGYANELPVGMQLLGPYFSEQKILNVIHLYQRMTNWHNWIAKECS